MITLDEQAERLESLKAGLMGAGALGLVSLLAWGGLLFLPPFVATLLFASPEPLTRWVHLAIATLSGFLFGVTYRYVVRQDQNPQLKTGAIMAFALVRGGAAVEPHLQWDAINWWLAVPLVESGVGFAIAALLIEGAIKFSLLQPRQ